MTELEIRDVFLGQDLIEQSLTGGSLRCEAMVGALLVQLRQRRHLVTGAIRRLRPDQSVLIVADERLRVVGSQTCPAEVRRSAIEVIRAPRIASRIEQIHELLVGYQVAAASDR